jgi:hypothetical protein
MPLGDLRDVSKGYVKNDTLIVEAEILTLSVSKLFSWKLHDFSYWNRHSVIRINN